MRRARLVDVALAVAFVVGGQVELRVHTGDGYAAGGTGPNTVLMLLVDGALVGWRLAPARTLALMAAILIGWSLVTAHDTYFWTTILPLGLVVYQCARRHDGPVGWGGGALATVALYSAAIHDASLRAAPSNLVTSILMFGGVVLTARLLRRQAHQRGQLDLALAQLSAEQARREEAAAQTERNRIAAETHDVVAHAVSEMVLQLGAARLGLQASRQEVPEQLAAAESTGRRALAELRGTLGLLPDHPDHGLAPVAGIAGIEDLVRRFGSAGLDVRLTPIDPALACLPTGLQLAVHRVLQESLTNVLKHAGRVRVDVTLRHDGDGIELDLVDRGVGPPAEGRLPSGGNGLVGMRERVTLYGGALTAGPAADGGWRVHARWPVAIGATA